MVSATEENAASYLFQTAARPDVYKTAVEKPGPMANSPIFQEFDEST